MELGWSNQSEISNKRCVEIISSTRLKLKRGNKQTKNWALWGLLIDVLVVGGTIFNESQNQYCDHVLNIQLCYEFFCLFF